LYRDYLIRALNDDVPFDQLVREHVAGDLLEEPRLNRQLGIVESAIGTAQWRMVFHGFAPTDALDERVRFIDDQINVFSKAFMGLTVSCARCHDHKFDPIGQDDYYALFGVMASNRASRHAIDHWPNLPQQTATLESLRESIRRTLATEWLDKIDDLTSRMQTSVENLHGSESPAVALLARLHQAHVSGESIEAVWKAEETRWRKAVGASEDDKDSANETDLGWRWNLSQIEDYAQWFRTGSGLPEIPSLAGQFAISTDGDQAVVGIYPAGAYSHQLSDKLPARLTSPDIQLEDEYELWIEAIGSGDSSIRYVVQDYPRDGTVYPVVRLNDNQWRWHRFDISYWNGDQVHVELAHAKDAPLLVVPRDRSWFGVRQVRVVRQGTWQPHAQSESLGPLFELAAKEFSSDLPSVLSVFRQAVSQAVDAWLNDRINDWQALLLDEAIRNGWLENRLSQLTKTASLVNEYRTLEAAIPVATRVPGLSEAQIVDQPLYVRGDHRQPAEPIARRFPSFVPGEDYPSDVSGRRELAEDLLRADNPLTRRVIVNRLWHHVFGRGIVATPDNFGLLGSEPTHPDLLDWLADTFSQEHGWSLKSLIRELVLSETWQQDSRPSPLSQHSDPDNRHWSHTIAGRLEAEIIRDQLLAVAQTLDQSVFGPPQSNDKYRRSVYLPVVRNSLDPLLRVFDFPEPFSSVGKRDATNVPAQSLALLNNPLVVESSLAVSRHLANDGEPASDSEKIKRLFWLCFSREATDSEEQELLRFLAEAREVQATLVRSRHKLRTELAESQRKSEKLLAELRRRTGVASDSDSSPIGTLVAPPIVAWEFDQEIDTANSTNGLKLINGAQITQGRLIMRDGGYAISSPMEKEISEKTLEAWVVLDDLDQRGGGVVSLQTADGNVFDSIVFGEQTPGAWLAGSEFFNRSQQVAGPVETSCGDEPIHVAITYRADGEISVFRNGQLYGKSYRTSGLVKFPADSVVTLGLRHLPAGDNRGLTGQIVRARLYDFALSTEQIAASYQQAAAMVPLWKVIEKMTDEERQLWESEIALRERIHNELELLGQMALEPEVEVWQQLVHALFMMQEFIYVR
ncbi:MAG TPA: DUF1553 domain-containing protein, partial [Pirellulaceae bacterium]|nr:DUF1553 domain-containing protein [Pirellulaceae bacterium]